MIETFRFNNKWRIKIVNETFEFEDIKQSEECLLLNKEDKNV